MGTNSNDKRSDGADVAGVGRRDVTALGKALHGDGII
jgi:hypothetical protein